MNNLAENANKPFKILFSGSKNDENQDILVSSNFGKINENSNKKESANSSAQKPLDTQIRNSPSEERIPLGEKTIH
jgi:hypothetical protein